MLHFSQEVITMNTNPSGIGARIKEARKAAKMSQTVLGTYLNKTLRTIQKYESGEIEPSIATINEIAKVLHVSSAGLMGYQKENIHLDTFNDILVALNEINNKEGLRFSIEVKRPPHAEGWTCSLIFDGKDPSAEYNADLCLFLEEFAEERERLETYWTDQSYFDRWFDKELAYHAGTKLPDKKVETLTDEERLKRRNALLQSQMEEAKNAAENSSGQ